MKKGLSLSTVVIAISIMLILVSSVSVIGSSAITSANFEEYKSNIDRVSDEGYYLVSALSLGERCSC